MYKNGKYQVSNSHTYKPSTKLTAWAAICVISKVVFKLSIVTHRKKNTKNLNREQGVHHPSLNITKRNKQPYAQWSLCRLYSTCM